MIFLNFVFSFLPKPWINTLKYFHFRGDIHKIVYFESNFRVTIPGNLAISRYCYTEILQPPGNNTLKFENGQVSLPGNFTTSNYWYLEIQEKNNFREKLHEITAKKGWVKLLQVTCNLQVMIFWSITLSRLSFPGGLILQKRCTLIHLLKCIYYHCIIMHPCKCICYHCTIIHLKIYLQSLLDNAPLKKHLISLHPIAPFKMHLLSLHPNSPLKMNLLSLHSNAPLKMSAHCSVTLKVIGGDRHIFK